MKKFLLFIALTIFGLGLNAQNVGDETTIDYNGYSLEFRITSVEPAECKVSDYTGSPTDVTIPSTVTISGIEFAVTSIGIGAFLYCSSLTSIEIPNSVTSIRASAFRVCSSLTSIVIPNSVTSIGNLAFYDCSSLRVIKCYAEDVPETGDDVFSDCPSNMIIYVPENSVEDYKAESPWNNYNIYINELSEGYVEVVNCRDYFLLFEITNVVSAKCGVSDYTGAPIDVTIPSTIEILGKEFTVTSIVEEVFKDCSSLTNVEIPNSITSIGNYAFYGCSSLTSIEIPNFVTSIGEYAFYDCSSLTSIEIPNSVTSIGEYAFYDCSSLTSVTFGENSQLTSIGDRAFWACSSLTSVTFGENSQLTSIGNYAFLGCSSLTSIEIPNFVTSIGEYAFYDCSSLTSVTFGENSQLTSIGDNAFRGCSSLTSIEIPNFVTSIGKSAFSGCSSLTSVTFGENSQLTSIGDWAFIGCSSLTSIDIPNSVTSIGNGAFEGCSSLTSIEIPNSVTFIGGAAFRDCSSLTNIEIPNSVTFIGPYAFEGCSSLTSIEIPNSVTYISYAEFRDCSSLKSIEIPNSVTYIDNEAFRNCSSLTSIEIPNSVTYIYQEAFRGCSILNVIKCYAENVPGIEANFFYGCPSDMTIYVPEVSLPEYKSTYPWYNYTIYSLSSLEGPRNVTATPTSDSSIELTWDESENAVGYNIYRDGYLVANVTGTSYSDGNLDSSTEYCYAITAAHNKTETDKSEEACATTFDLQITTPENLVATPTSISSIELTWNETEKALGYNIYRDGDLLTNITGTSYSDENLNIYTEYCYAITAVHYEIETDKSEEVCATTFDWPITTPENLVATPTSDYSIELTWNKVENALSYNIYRDGDLLVNITETSYSDENLNSYTEYCYAITAVRNETETDKSEEVCTTTFDLPITTPENLIATPTSASSISLSWDEVEKALSYNIYRGGYFLTNITGTSYSDENLNSYTEYCYAITAVRNETETDKSEEKCVKTFDLPITTPENLVAEALSTSSISLSWDAVENALSYNVYQADEVIANVEETTFTVDSLEYNTEYCYIVTAVRGDEESEKSKMVCAKTLGESLEELSSSINIYPNPVENELFITTEVRVNEVSIYDIYGRLCCRDASNASTSNSMDTFNVSVQDLEAGVYFVKVVTNEGEVVKRFVKK